MVGSRLQQLFVREETQQTATSQTDHTHKQFKEVHSITYALPGQVGFCVPDIIKESKYRQSLIALLEGDNLVTSLQVNNTTGSILISYKAGVMPDVEMRSHFANLIESVSDEWNADEQAKMQPVIADTNVSQIEAKDTRVSPRLLRSFSRAINKFLPASVFRAASTVASTDEQAKQPAKVAYSIAHSIPGRVRFRVPRVVEDPKYVQRLQSLLKAEPTVTEQRVNRLSGSITITYKSPLKLNTQTQDWEAAISHLVNLLENASDVAFT
ncbi:hypothetical protein BLD44_006990 [Mastigocladus laminosus UU774]|nr:hypothetical protein BLD44_006990 [Mastigocladus laminosus UU774]